MRGPAELPDPAPAAGALRGAHGRGIDGQDVGRAAVGLAVDAVVRLREERERVDRLVEQREILGGERPGPCAEGIALS